ncbi:hypothetical protein ADIMK_1265 [Marinobacterium lacunae]|uniref:Transporter n=1 Tax=Marinobacterium lacunae TaxID=1232683 RepID=A0A081G207_9GAMM|nr:YitT family protein [Marinobacterium lacunae]KEA64812.1 hypothetical protein ADIMK_1265 [Marinobacterium lacunae]MBR9882864.1 YitT family protein [Oceanospirillales bacterium]
MVFTHRWLSILEGCLLVALGIHLLNSAHLLISGTAGLGLTLQYVTGLTFGTLFFILNLPFYLLAARFMGLAFTSRTFAAVSLLTLLSVLMDRWLEFSIAEPAMAAILGGLLVGFGLIILFRHQTSLGGINILAIYLERRFNIHAGKTTLACDVLILVVGCLVFPPEQILYSLLAFLSLSSVMGRYHRPPAWAQAAQPAR